MGPLANEALCLSTPKHNGKSGTDYGSTHMAVQYVLWMYPIDWIYFQFIYEKPDRGPYCVPCLNSITIFA